MSNEKSWRVKVYHLESDGTWNEVGTGNVFYRGIQDMGAFLVVESEIDSSTILLQSKISLDEIYDRQNENIILWNEVIGNSDFGIALSFQDTAGCQSIWSIIQEFRASRGGYLDNFVNENRFQSDAGSSAAANVQLLPCSLENLVDLRSKVNTIHPVTKHQLATLLLQDECKYVMELIQLFGELESDGNTELLNVIAEIWRGIFFLNEPRLVEFLMKDDIFLQVCGAMEYDKSLSVRGNYRTFLTSKVKFRSVLDHIDPELKSQSQKLFRLKFLKDYLLRPTIDEVGIGALASLINTTTEIICSIAFNDSDYVKDILTLFNSPDQTAEVGLSCLQYLRELFLLSRHLLFEKRVEFYRNFLSVGASSLFGGLIRIYSSDSTPTEERLYATEILVSIVVAVPSVVRSYILSGPTPMQVSSEPNTVDQENVTVVEDSLNSNMKCLLFCIIKRLVEETEHSVIEQLGDTLRVLLDCERMDKIEKDKFLGLFYDHYVIWLVTPILEPNNPCLEFRFSKVSNTTRIPQDMSAISTSRRVLYDILSLGVQQHSYRMKYFLMRHGILPRSLLVLESRHRHIHLSVIKFIRAVVSLKEEFYLRHIVKFDILKPLFKLLEKSSARDNLLVSAIIEFVEFIKVQGIKVLIEYIVENHSSSFDNLSHDCYDKLRLKYDQMKESNDLSPSIEISANSKLDENRKLNELEMEEAYLLGDEDDDNTNSLSPHDKSPASKVLTSDIYSDDASHLKGCPPFVDELDIGKIGSSVFSFSKVFETSNNTALDSEKHLPPLKPKFESGLDDDAVFNVKSFSHPSNLSSIKVSDVSASDTSIFPFTTSTCIEDDRVDSSHDTSQRSLGGGISFSMKKRKI